MTSSSRITHIDHREPIEKSVFDVYRVYYSTGKNKTYYSYDALPQTAKNFIKNAKSAREMKDFLNEPIRRFS